jgi:hypothetical protein
MLRRKSVGKIKMLRSKETLAAQHSGVPAH